MSQHPARFIGPPIWTYEGTVYGIWALTSQPYRRAPQRDKLAVHRRLSAAAQVLPGDWMVLGLSVPVTAKEVKAGLTAHVDLAANPGWAERAERDTAKITRAGLHRRVHYLCAALPGPSGEAGWRMPLAAASARVGRRFGLVPPPVRMSEFETYRRIADDTEASLHRALGGGIRAATTAEVLWLYARSAMRGCPGEPALGDYGSPKMTTEGEGPEARLRCAALRDLDDAHYFEGGAGGPITGRQYIQVEGERGTSFQTVLALADMPEEWTYPGSGFLAHLDTLPFPVDSCVRVSSTSNAETQAQVRKQLRELAGQDDELAGDTAGTGQIGVARAIDTLNAEYIELADNPNAPGLKPTFLFALGASTHAEMTRRVKLLRDAFGASEWQMHAPTGDQDALHGAMLPGGPCPPAVEHYRQFMLPSGLAGCAWLAGNAVGEVSGAWLGRNIDSTKDHASPVLYDPANGPRSGRSGSFAAVGSLGAGKSHLLKTIVLNTVERGGVVVVTDRTGGSGGQDGEYVRLRHVFSPGKRTQIVPVGYTTSGPATVMDPIAAFRHAPDDANRYATGFLTLITGTVVRSSEGGVLEEAVAQVVAAGGRLADVGPLLEEMSATDEAARRVADRLRRFSRSGGLADVAFSRGEPVRLDADYIVFHAPNLVLPDAEQMDKPDSLLPEQIVGVGTVYLIAAMARSVILSDDERFGLYLQDEAYVFNTPEGQQVLREFAKDGRKRAGAVGLGGHHPHDFGNARLMELLTVRFAFRMDTSAAMETLPWLGEEVTPANIASLSEAERYQGECLARFADGSVGLVEVNPAPSEAAAAAFDTTPGARAVASARRARHPRVVDAVA